MHSGFFSSSNSLSAANGYRVSVSQHDVNGDCLSTLVISGHGIDKKIEYPCATDMPAVINLHKSLLVGDYFTDTPGELIHLIDGHCDREVFEKVDGKMTSTQLPLDDKECEKVKVKVEVLREEQVKWEEWYKHQQELAQQQFMMIQQNLMNLQQNLFGNFFTGFGGFWGKK